MEKDKVEFGEDTLLWTKYSTSFIDSLNLLNIHQGGYHVES